MLVLAGVEFIFFIVVHIRLYFCISDENGANSIEMFFIIAKQHLHSFMAFSTSYATPPVKSLGMHKKLRGDRAETADPD